MTHPIDIWESEDFVLLQRPSNTGFKAGSLKRLDEYLSAHNIDYMYLLDADWHPQPDALERAFEILETDKQIAFVQTKRVSRPEGMSLFQKLVSVMEETCYFVDFEGRQLLGHPVLFSGCCALLRLPYVRQVGGFTPGNLTEDLDLSNRLWLAGKKGAYSGDIVNTGEVPFSYDHYRRQQERWAAGTSHALRKYFFPVFASKVLSWTDKASIFRQNAYYFSNMLTVVAFVTGLFTVVWISVYWGHYSVEYYLLMMSAAQVPISILVYLCVFSTVFGPIVMIVFKKKRYQDLAYLPLSVWYAWSLIYTYFIGNLRGFAGVQTDWFRTPKFNRAFVGNLGRSPLKNRLISGVTCSVFLGFYFLEGWAFGWIDIFAVIWIPSMLIATFK